MAKKAFSIHEALASLRGCGLFAEVGLKLWDEVTTEVLFGCVFTAVAAEEVLHQLRDIKKGQDAEREACLRKMVRAVVPFAVHSVEAPVEIDQNSFFIAVFTFLDPKKRPRRKTPIVTVTSSPRTPEKEYERKRSRERRAKKLRDRIETGSALRSAGRPSYVARDVSTEEWIPTSEHAREVLSAAEAAWKTVVDTYSELAGHMNGLGLKPLYGLTFTKSMMSRLLVDVELLRGNRLPG